MALCSDGASSPANLYSYGPIHVWPCLVTACIAVALSSDGGPGLEHRRPAVEHDRNDLVVVVVVATGNDAGHLGDDGRHLEPRFASGVLGVVRLDERLAPPAALVRVSDPPRRLHAGALVGDDLQRSCVGP